MLNASVVIKNKRVVGVVAETRMKQLSSVERGVGEPPEMVEL